jgi:hypothetical protein
MPEQAAQFTQEGLSVTVAVEAMLRRRESPPEQAARDLDQAESWIRQLIAAPPIVAQAHQGAGAILQAILAMKTVLGLDGGGDINLKGLYQTLSEVGREPPEGAPGRDFIERMRADLAGQAATGGGGAGAGPLHDLARGHIEREAGLHSTLRSLLQEFAGLLGEGGDEHRLASIRRYDGSGGLPDGTVLLLVDAALEALAYRPAAEADHAVRLATAVLGGGLHDAPVDRGKAHLLAALAHTMRGHWTGNPDDLRSAAGHLVESVTLMSPEHPLSLAAVGLLGVVLDDRFLLGGPVADRQTVGQLADTAEKVFLAHHTPAADPGRLTVARAIRYLCRAARAVGAGDRSGLVAAADALRAALRPVPESYPWLGRLAAGLGLAQLVLQDTGGAEVLLAAEGAMPAYHSARSGLAAVAGIAAVLTARTGDVDGAAVAVLADRAVELLSRPPDAGRRIIVDRTEVLTALGSAHLLRAQARDDSAELDRGIGYLTQARDRSASRPAARAYWLLGELATALRRRGDSARGDLDASVHCGLAAMRAAAAAVPLASDGTQRLALAREAARFALTLVDWCAGDGQDAQAAQAAEWARVLMVQAGTGVDLPDRLLDAGQPDLGDEWIRATSGPLVPARLRDLFDLAPPAALYQRVQGALHAPAQRIRSAGDVGEALRSAGADLLCYLLPGGAHAPGRLVWIDAGGQIGVVAAPGLATPPGSDASLDQICGWAWRAVFEPLLAAAPLVPAPAAAASGAARGAGPGRLVLVPHGELGRVPWHAARAADGRYAGVEFLLSYAGSASSIANSGRPGRRTRQPLARQAVLVGDPMHDDPSASALSERLRRLYPEARGLGRTGRPADLPATAERVAGTLPDRDSAGASMVQLQCRARLAPPPAGASLELAARHAAEPSSTLTTGRLLRHPSTAGEGGLVVLCVQAVDELGDAFDPALTLPAALRAAGVSGVAGSGWSGLPAADPTLVLMLHHFLVEGRLAPREAVGATYRWAIDPGRKFPAHLGAPLSALDGLADPVRWAGLRYEGC